MTQTKDALEKDFSPRQPINSEVDAIIQTRFSPRAFTGEAISDDVVETLFDAARQAPSCFNEQPWRFYCSSDNSFNDFLSFLVPQNADWSEKASRLVVVAAESRFAHNDKPNKHSWFDTGSAWYSFAYQARVMGLYTHAMAGIHEDIIRERLRLPESQEVICAVAVGVVDEQAAQMEEISARKSLTEILSII